MTREKEMGKASKILKEIDELSMCFVWNLRGGAICVLWETVKYLIILPKNSSKLIIEFSVVFFSP